MTAADGSWKSQAGRRSGTGLANRPRAIVQRFIKRWTIETTFEESRAHLGLETQRQWSDRAIERTTPCLFGLYSMVTLLAHALHPDGKVQSKEQLGILSPMQRLQLCGLLSVGMYGTI
jgi:hypothetical protein